MTVFQFIISENPPFGKARIVEFFGNLLAFSRALCYDEKNL